MINQFLEILIQNLNIGFDLLFINQKCLSLFWLPGCYYLHYLFDLCPVYCLLYLLFASFPDYLASFTPIFDHPHSRSYYLFSIAKHWGVSSQQNSLLYWEIKSIDDRTTAGWNFYLTIRHYKNPPKLWTTKCLMMVSITTWQLLTSLKNSDWYALYRMVIKVVKAIWNFTCCNFEKADFVDFTKHEEYAEPLATTFPIFSKH